VVVYEDTLTREVAVSFCDGLVQRFWAQAGFEVNWWSFEHLARHPEAQEAAGQAVDADILVFSVGSTGDVPRHIREWAEGWLRERQDREGTLIGLAEGRGAEGGADLYLRQLAHRAGMDYLTQLPQDLSEPMPESFDSYAERAGQVTGVLDEILHHSPRQEPPAASHDPLFR